MKIKVKFANKDVYINKLVQGAVLLELLDNGEFDIFHIHKFQCLYYQDNSVDLIVADDWGKKVRNTKDLTWPI